MNHKDLQERVRAGYRRSSDPAFADLIADVAPGDDDDALADLIEADGRERLRLNLKVEFERYLGAIPDLRARPVALDAAIEFALRGGAAATGVAGGKGAASEADAAQRLRQRYPDLSESIDAARELSRALQATVAPGVSGGAAAPGARPLALPCDVGPLSVTGKPRYKLLSRLGVGSQGTTYVAEDRQLSGPGPTSPALVCVKILTFDPRAEGRASGEAGKARRINHPNVVRVLDRGVFQGHEYIVYELIEGHSLDVFLASRGRPLKQAEAARLLVRVARGVQAAHSTGVVHRDLKPDNILMTAAGEPKVTDFGAAATVELDGTSPERRTESGKGEGRAARVGNLAFMAPEQFWMGDGAISPTADVYALGGLLVYLVTGQLPNGATAEEVKRKHASGDGGGAGAVGVDGPSHENRATARDGSRVDRDLLAIMRRAMAATPGERHTSADALAADLEDWLAHRPIAWTRPSLGRQFVLAVRRQPLLILLLVCLLVIVWLSVLLVAG